MAGNIFNVSSYGQSGGITAGQVIVGRPPRQLDSEGRAKLRELVPRDKSCIVVANMGDPEALQFAHTIHSFLTSDGYSVAPQVGQQLRTVTPVGVSVELYLDPVQIWVGQNA